MGKKYKCDPDMNILVEVMLAVVRRLFRFLLLVAGCFTYPVVYLASRRRKKYLPPITNPLLKVSATKLAHMIRNKEVRSEDLISAYVERCKVVNPILNAIVEDRYELALKEARSIDLLIASNQHSVEELEIRFPLLGIPISVKESIAVAGMSNDAGRCKPVKVPASADAECVSQVRAAGAIPIAVTNTPELCMCWETFNYVTGVTHNPHNTRRTPGGSSGGEAALISSGASLMGIGSDIGGSLRLPAMYTGIFGHKPTPRAVSTSGHLPGCKMDEWNDYFTLGPMTRYAEDLPLLMKSLNNPNGPNIPYDKVTSMHNIRFYYMENDGTGVTNVINDDMLMAMERVKIYMKKKYGITLIKAEFKHMKYSFESTVLNIISLNGVETIFSKPGNPSEWTSVTVQLVKKIFGCSKSILCSILYGILKKTLNNVGEESYRRAAKINTNLQQEFKDLLRDDGVCIYPTFPKTATYHTDYFRHLADYCYLLVFNALGLPVTNCPVGLTNRNMPVGVQVVANPGCDHLLFSVARDFEDAFGGWLPPPSTKK